MALTHAVFDVDDVVLNMDEAASRAESALVEPLAERMTPEKAAEVQQRFSSAYDLLRRRLRSDPDQAMPEADRLLERIRFWQTGVADAGHELKIFSRESLLAFALESADQTVDAQVIHSAIDHYWRVQTEATRIFDDARRLIPLLMARGVQVHLATNSDGFLIFEEGTLRYDPEHSWRRKYERMAIVSELGIREQDVSIGDPIGKPRREFAESVLERFGAATGAEVPVGDTITVGDSLGSDILPLLELGVSRGAWLVREGGFGATPEDERVLRIRSLDELEALF